MCVLCFCGRSVLYCGRQPKQVIKSDLEEISPDCLSIIHPSKKDVCVHRGWWTRVACPGLCSCPAQMRCFGSGRRCSWWSVCGCAEEGLLSGTAGSPLAAESSGVYSPHLGSGSPGLSLHLQTPGLCRTSLGSREGRGAPAA